MTDGYAKALKLERDRESEKRKRDQAEKSDIAAQRNFERGFHHLGDLPHDGERYESWVSDKGDGVERIIDACDREANFYRRRLNSARQSLIRNHRDWLPVFNLVIKNGSANREESIACLTLKRLRKLPNGKPPKCTTGTSCTS